MPKKELSLEEIAKLMGLYSKVFAYITELRKTEDLAKHLQYPKMPSILTESMILHLLKENKILQILSSFQFSFGGKIADIIGEKGIEVVKIEVKGTTNSFQYFGPKDINADYLIWIYLGDTYFSKNDGIIRIYILKPKGLFNNPIKITLKKLLNDFNDKIETIEFPLTDFLSGK